MMGSIKHVDGTNVLSLVEYKVLSDEFFEDLTFENVVFENENFHGTVFHGCRFSNCDFGYANLGNVVFEKCIFDNCQFMRANITSTFVESELTKCGFDYASMGYCRFEKTKISESSFNMADFQSAVFVASVISDSKFFGCSVLEMHFGDSLWTNVDFSWSADWDTSHRRQAKLNMLTAPETGYFANNEQEYWDKKRGR